MDPLTAVGLAGNIFQFISFVGGLLDQTRKLHASATGNSRNNDYIRDVCSTLVRLSAELQNPPTSTENVFAGKLSQHGKQLSECATACSKECEDLLHIMNQLSSAGTKGPRYWRSFRAALAEVWKENEIADLRRRIADRQGKMALLITMVSNESIRQLESHIQKIGRGIWKLHTDSRLDLILNEIRVLKQSVIAYGKAKPFTTDSLDGICDSFSKLSLDAAVLGKEAEILSSLDYSERETRHDKIADAHVITFKWSLQETEETEEKYSKLRRWFESNDSLNKLGTSTPFSHYNEPIYANTVKFWVSGKPGSGKSTFIKWIDNNNKTRKCLETWAGEHKLIVASHYFTIYGTPSQRSLEGLLRSLVFSIFVEIPELIPRLMAVRWNRTGQQSRWTQSELESVLKAHEYDGDHLDICQTLIQLSQCPSIKVCVSSRPWNVFEDALGDRPNAKLYMHDLTRGDIRNYTHTRLREHPRWNILEELDGSVLSWTLIDEVVEKSNGVFLWVTLVVNLLREGLNNDDHLLELQRRLLSFPSDLEPFFRHIIDAVDPFYREKMAGMLLLALEAKAPLRFEIYSFHEMEYADEDYAFSEPAKLLDTDSATLGKLYALVSRRINGLCKQRSSGAQRE
ncbi:hypothetical protein GGR57DRAFT_508155 [Xylariaceae sp. FL1272]|nr:hypothetical protein GGR57DRAFT_508155 [Xylariaceae sp. FL1272]